MTLKYNSATVASVAAALAAAVASFIPAQPRWLYSAQVIVSATVAVALHIRALLLAFRQRVSRTAAMRIARIMDGPIPVVPFLLGGLLFGRAPSSALALIATGIILMLLAAVENGWVLLIEILR